MNDEPFDPLTDIETENGRKDTGACSYLMLQGAKEKGADQTEAFMCVAAYYCGMFMSMNLDVDVEDLLEDDEDE